MLTESTFQTRTVRVTTTQPGPCSPESPAESWVGPVFERRLLGDQRLRSDRHALEDATQTVWLRSQQSEQTRGRRRATDRAGIAAWYCRIAKNVMHDEAQRRARRPGTLGESEVTDLDQDDPSRRVELSEIYSVVATAIASMSAPYRSVVELVIGEQFTPNDLSTRLEISVDAARMLRNRALSQLRVRVARVAPSLAAEFAPRPEARVARRRTSAATNLRVPRCAHYTRSA